MSPLEWILLGGVAFFGTFAIGMWLGESLALAAMILPAGWYVYLSPDPDSPQTDIHGPFDSCLELVLWMGEHKIRLEADRRPPKSAPRLVSEMTDGESGPVVGFGIHLRT